MASSNSCKPHLPLFPLTWYIPLHGVFADTELIRLLESLSRLYEERWRRRRALEEQAEEEERSVRRRLTLELSSDED